jgi:Mg-chelatase subunit ChlD
VVALATSALATPMSDAEWRAARKRALGAASQGDGKALVPALEEVAKDDSARAVELVVQVGAVAPDGPSWAAAVKALQGMTGAEASAELCARLRAKKLDPRARILLCDATAGREDAESGAALGGALEAKEPEVLRAALAAVRKRRPREAVEPLFGLFGRLTTGKEADGLLATSVREALWELTAQCYETEEDWRKWWATAQGEFRPRTGDAGPPPGTSQREKPRPTFFGTELRSDRLVFVIDISGSMEAEGRIGRAKAQLEQAIGALSDKARFTVLAFSSGCRVWEKQLVPASPQNRQKALEFVRGLTPTGNTLTLGAMKAGFEVEGADAIVLLSDGFPTETNNATGQPMQNDEVLSEIAALNRFKRWRIDTFGFASANMADFMKRLAEESGGTYTEIK